MDYWKIQDAFYERMKKDYEGGAIANPVYKPYFQWKFYGESVNTLTRELCFQIMKEAQRELEELDNRHPGAHEQLLVEPTLDDVRKPYKGYDDDCFLYSYLIGIEAEITNIFVMKCG